MSPLSESPSLVLRPVTPDQPATTYNEPVRYNLWEMPRLNRRFVKLAIAILVVMYILEITSLVIRSRQNGYLPNLSPLSLDSKGMNTTSFLAPFQALELGRMLETRDAFANYKYRATCNISSLDLHTPFGALCPDRKSMLEAMSSGGRIGMDAPYMSRGCDMHWFSTEEACDVLSRYKIIIVGDSMMRHLIGSINIIIRENLGKECFCNDQFDVRSCSVQGIYKSADVIKNDPTSLACPAATVDIHIEQINKWPIPTDEISRFRALLPSKKPNKPYVFIFGQGLWNDLSLTETLKWVDEIHENSVEVAPWLEPTHGQRMLAAGTRSQVFWPRLFVTPNAAGRSKSDEYLKTQGNKKLMEFEEGVRIEGAKRGIEHLGTWNMSIQANKPDGTHCDAKGNLLKAMMVLNWLALLDPSEF